MKNIIFTILLSFCFANAFNCDEAEINEWNGFGKQFELKCYDNIHDSIVYEFLLEADGTWYGYYEGTYNKDGTHTRNDVFWDDETESSWADKSVRDEFGVYLKDICYKVKLSYMQKFITKKWLKMKKYFKK